MADLEAEEMQVNANHQLLKANNEADQHHFHPAKPLSMASVGFTPNGESKLRSVPKAVNITAAQRAIRETAAGGAVSERGPPQKQC